jgi:hypothetical protein
MFLRLASLIALVFSASLLCQAQATATCDNWTYFNTFTASGINNQGVVVGSAYVNFGWTAYIREPNGTTHQYVAPNGGWTQLARQNSNGVTVGSYYDSGGNAHGLVLFGSKAAALNFPGAFETILYGVNDSQWVVGIYGYGDFSQPYDGFVRTASGKFTILGYPPAEMTNPMAVNDAGTVVGWWVPKQAQPPFPDYGFVWINGEYTVLNYPNVERTLLNDINAAGVIAGSYQNTETGAEGGFIYVNGVFENVVAPNAQVQTVDGINDFNYITGTSSAGSFIAHCQ